MIIIWESGLFTSPWAFGGSGFVWTDLSTPIPDVVPLGDCQVEILYAIPISAKSNLAVFRKDSMEYNSVQKSAVKWRHEWSVLRFRIRDIHIDDFYQFHVTHKGLLVELNTPGIQPFIRASESNNVIVAEFKEPILDKPKHFTMSVTYIREEILP